MFKILIAEDEEILRRNLTLILNKLGYSAVSVKSCEEAIKRLDKTVFDVVITDLVMPAGGGSELIRYIFEYYPDCKVIIITAYPSADSAINAIKKGVFDYFTKPFKTEDILDAVKKAVEHRKEKPFIWEKLNSYGVTPREASLLRFIVEEGITENKDIAESFAIKVTTVKQHFENLYAKFGAKNRASLISAVVNALRK